MTRTFKLIVKSLKWICIAGLVFLAGTIAIIAILNYSAGARLTKKRAELASAGQPLSFAELKPKPVPPDQDAMPILQANSSEISRIANYVSTHFAEDTLSPEQFEELGKYCREHAALITTLRETSKLPFANSVYDFSGPRFMDHVGSEPNKFRGPARVLFAESRYFSNSGEPNRALENANAITRWGRLAGKQPTIVAFIISIVYRDMGTQTASSAIRAGANDVVLIAELKRLLDELESDENWQYALSTERAYAQTLSATQFHPILRSMWFFSNWQIEYLDMLQAAQSSGGSTSAQFSDLINKKKYSSWMAVSLLPALQAAHGAQLKMVANARSLRALNAWSESGRFANNIEELKLPKAFTIDPYNGLSLRWKVTENGPIIYSVGMNGIDDGGQISNDSDIGIGPNRDE